MRSKTKEWININKEKALASHFFNFSAYAHLAHLQSRTSQHTTQTLQKSQIFQPTKQESVS